jgi:hypothetical protein
VQSVNGAVGTVSVNAVGSADLPITYDVGTQTVGIDSSGYVASVNGATGTAVLDTDDVAEGTGNLYFTEQRARRATLDPFFLMGA